MALSKDLLHVSHMLKNLMKGIKSFRLPRHFVTFILHHPVASAFLSWYLEIKSWYMVPILPPGNQIKVHLNQFMAPCCQRLPLVLPAHSVVNNQEKPEVLALPNWPNSPDPVDQITFMVRSSQMFIPDETAVQTLATISNVHLVDGRFKRI